MTKRGNHNFLKSLGNKLKFLQKKNYIKFQFFKNLEGKYHRLTLAQCLLILINKIKYCEFNHEWNYKFI